MEDIVEPARVLGTSTPLPPLPDTQSPTTLGDEDSRFLQVNDVCRRSGWQWVQCASITICVCIYHHPHCTVDGTLQGGCAAPQNTTAYVQWCVITINILINVKHTTCIIAAAWF